MLAALIMAAVGAGIGHVARRFAPQLSRVKDEQGIRVPWPEVVGALLAAGADVNACTSDGVTALHKRLTTALSLVSVRMSQGERFLHLPGYRRAERYYTPALSRTSEVLKVNH